MSLFDRVNNFAKTLYTYEEQLKHLQNGLDEARQNIHNLGEHVQDIRQRVTRLEAERNAERREMEALISRFQLEVERAELRMRALPPTEKS